MAYERDAPARVVLVNHLEGQAAVQLAGSDTWIDDLVNRPLASGDRLWIEDGARAELHIGSMVLRLGPRSALRLVQVDDRQVRLRLTAGSVNVRLRTLDDDDAVVMETPAADLELLAPGGYRIDSGDGSDRAQFTVWSGRALVRGPQLLRELRNDEAIDVDADDDSPSIARADQPDRLDLWAEQRDRQEEESRAARYVPREMVGYAELDAWGDWDDDPVYGAIWMPRYVDAGWAPFRFGYWSYIGPWGWTWIDDAPWGFAPCHYGRWVQARHGWAWAPGGRRELRRPVFSAAVVTWVGMPPGRHDDPRHGDRVGWAPLGHERDPRGYTAVDRDTFVSSRPVAPRRVNVPDGEWRRARPVDAPRVEPGDRSIGRVVPRDRVLPDRAIFERGGGLGLPAAPGAGIRPRLPEDARGTANAPERPAQRPSMGPAIGSGQVPPSGRFGTDNGADRGIDRGNDRGIDRGVDRGPGRGVDRVVEDRPAIRPQPMPRDQPLPREQPLQREQPSGNPQQGNPQRDAPTWQRQPERAIEPPAQRDAPTWQRPPERVPDRAPERVMPRFERSEPAPQPVSRPEPPQQYNRPEPVQPQPVFRAPPQPPAPLPTFRAPTAPPPSAPPPQRAAPAERAPSPVLERRGGRDQDRHN
jgi:hypothetical protein